MVGWWFWWLAAPLAAAPQLAFHSDRAGNYDIYAIAPTGGDLVNLTAHPAQDKWPAWSPDGTRLAFASNRDGDFEIYVLEDGAVRQVTDHPALDTWPCWSPDGNRLAFTSHRDGNYEVYLADAAGGEPANLSRHAAFDGKPSWGQVPELSGPGIVFSSTRTGDYDLFAVREDGGPVIRLERGEGIAREPALGAAGMAYAEVRQGRSRVVWRPLEQSRGVEPTAVLEGSLPQPVETGDGQPGLLLTAQRQGSNDIYLQLPSSANLWRLTNSPADDAAPAWPGELPFPLPETGSLVVSLPTPLPPIPASLRAGPAVDDFLLTLAAAARPGYARLDVEVIGLSQRHRPLLMATVAAAEPAQPAPWRVLVVCAQHGDEPAGTRAMLELLRRVAAQDQAVTRLLTRVELAVIAVANPDGAERFSRFAANGGNLNRDWNRGALPETAAIREVIARLSPQVVLDLHEQTPVDREGAYVLGMGGGTRDLLHAVRAAFRRHGVSAPVFGRPLSSDTRLLHRWFAAEYGRAGFLVESKWTSRPERNLAARVKLHRVTVLAVLEALDRRRQA